MIITLFVVFFLLILMNVPIALSLAGACIVPLLFFSDLPMTVVAQKMFSGVNTFTLMAIPFFTIAGALLEKGGVSKRLVRLANALIGWIPGGLAMVVFVASAFFGAISGSAVATVSAIGSIMLPTMREEGYSLKFSLGTIATAGYLGIIVPPSIPMVLFGQATGTSIGDLFLGGFIPGLLLALVMGIYGVYFGIKHPEIKRHKFSLKNLWEAFKGSILALLMPVIVLGGIYGSIFTPTEAAAVSIVYGLIVGCFVYKEIKLSTIREIIRSSVITTAMILFVCATATALAYVFALNDIPQMLANGILSLCKTRWQFWILVTVFLLFCGMIMDTPPNILILAPLLTPVAESYGIKPVAFGIIMIINLGIGMVTPPVGMNAYVAAGLCRTNVKNVITKHMWIYLGFALACMILFMAFPDIITFLPNLKGS